MKNKIINILGYPKQTYEMIVFDLFAAWCISHSYENAHLQLMISNNKLYNWWMREYQKQEREFVWFVKPFIGVSHVGDLRKLYKERVSNISYYPKSLLDKIRKSAGNTVIINTENCFPKPNYSIN